MFRKFKTLIQLLRQLGNISVILAKLDQILIHIRELESRELNSRISEDRQTKSKLISGNVSHESSLQAIASNRLGSELLISLSNGISGIFVPIDYIGVIQSRPSHFIYDSVRARIQRDEDHINSFISRLSPFLDCPALAKIPSEEKVSGEPFWNNGYFSGDDARFLFSFMAAFKPKRVMEIGSGNSTKFIRLAMNTYTLKTILVSIDPVPRANVDKVADCVIPSSLLEVPLAEFDSLEPGDLLFHDGSHLTFNGSDTVCLFLDVLPRIKSGVFVHIHDIQLPYEYSSSFDGRGYSEQYMLASALLFGNQWEVLAPIEYLRKTGRVANGGGSFWMRKV